ncbi:uncharacterized protein J3R85_003701 [Psidium guajava]|nr:uncharacterized protein J3R85_003701 [Psidium guajava]
MTLGVAVGDLPPVEAKACTLFSFPNSAFPGALTPSPSSAWMSPFRASFSITLAVGSLRRARLPHPFELSVSDHITLT